MAEALMRADHGDRFEVYSAGTLATRVSPLASFVMKELAIDLSGQSSKTTDALRDLEFDVVVTVCDKARENCPYFSGVGKMVHKSFEDPSDSVGSLAERQDAFRRTRDEIRAWMSLWVKSYFG